MVRGVGLMSGEHDDGDAIQSHGLCLYSLIPHPPGHGVSFGTGNEADEEVKPFVADFYDLFERSRDAVMNSSGGEEMSETECRELWANHYSLIANKYGAGGILEW